MLLANALARSTLCTAVRNLAQHPSSRVFSCLIGPVEGAVVMAPGCRSSDGTVVTPEPKAGLVIQQRSILAIRRSGTRRQRHEDASHLHQGLDLQFRGGRFQLYR